MQLDHRLLALGTLGVYSLMYAKARKGAVWNSLPSEAKQALNWTMIAVGGQVAGGITMLVSDTPTIGTIVHQTGAAAVLGTSLWSMYNLRFARPYGIIGAAQAASKM